MSHLLSLVSCLLLSSLTARSAYDSYQDALDKYAAWHQRHGLPSRVERNVQKNVVQSAVFVPHRPRDGGAKFVVSPPLTLSEFENEVVGPNVFRNTRQPANYQVGLGGAEYVTSDGTPLYKVKRRYPLGYGRRKRDLTSAHTDLLTRTKRQWELLDPSTGRTKFDKNYPREASDFFQENHQNLEAPLNRPERKTKRKTDAYISDSGKYLYKLRNSNPYYGRRRRNANGRERVLVRVPRSIEN